MKYVDATWIIAALFDFILFLGGRQLAEVVARPARPLANAAPASEVAVYTPAPELGLSATRRRRRFALTLKIALTVFAAASLALLPPHMPFAASLPPVLFAIRAVNRIELFAVLAAPILGFVSSGAAASATATATVTATAAAGEKRVLSTAFRVFKPLAFPLTLAYVSFFFAVPAIFPLEEGVEFQNRSADGLAISSAGALDGVAALRNCMAALGLETASESEIAVEARVSAVGADIWQLARCAAANGCVWRFEGAGGDAIFGVDTPALTRVEVVGGGGGGAKRSSYVAILSAEARLDSAANGEGSGAAKGATGETGEVSANVEGAGASEADGGSRDEIVVADPAEGKIIVSRGEFLSRYTPIGPALCLRARGGAESV